MVNWRLDLNKKFDIYYKINVNIDKYMKVLYISKSTSGLGRTNDYQCA